MTLALKYPKSLLRERVSTFLDTVSEGHSRASNQRLVFAAPLLLYDDTETAVVREFLTQSAAVYLVNAAVRRAFTSTFVFGSGAVGQVLGLTWEILPALALLTVAVVVLLARRQWLLFLLAGCAWARVPLVFLTAPDTYFMYYLSPYTAGCILAAAGAVYCILRRKNKAERAAK